jgi:nitrogen-specific signal transduction histidine kinase
MDAQTFLSPLSHIDAAGMLESIAVPVLVLDRDCCVVFANCAARTLLRVGLRELRGQPVDLLFTEGSRLRGVLSALVAAGADTRVRPLRVAVRELTRPERQLALKAQPIDDDVTGKHLIVQLARVRQKKARPVLQLLPQSVAPLASTLDAPPAALVASSHQLECA